MRAIGSNSRLCQAVHFEVFRATDIQIALAAAEAFFALMPKLQVTAQN